MTGEHKKIQVVSKLIHFVSKTIHLKPSDSYRLEGAFHPTVVAWLRLAVGAHWYIWL
ncbi:hypothetical protein COMA1_80042 [Candidatus Nitrospira nitrosa]|uniref:Uncharacterized protein n=1 Tax=Candidatus Nitrospira nitrosa TaxID=1742972 RepID=A0A0S4LS62_9BACT|nr:hypothetical protein COMA1_80042 [Candidatus Nitrospira nitrosa]